jgi:hypothetical protein
MSDDADLFGDDEAVDNAEVDNGMIDSADQDEAAVDEDLFGDNVETDDVDASCVIIFFFNHNSDVSYFHCSRVLGALFCRLTENQCIQCQALVALRSQ